MADATDTTKAVEVVNATPVLPGKVAVLAAVAGRLWELAVDLVEKGDAEWDHLEALKRSLAALVTSIDRGRQMFGWLDEVQGGSTLRAAVDRTREQF